MKTVTAKIISSNGTEYIFEKEAVASINPKNCVNCGKCREVCPVGAISERQRTICRVCPECTGKPALTLDDMYSLATEKACTTACPLGISPQGYVNLAGAGKLNEAYELIWEKNPLPSVCARVCHHPCEQACKRGILVDEPIAIRSIKRYLGEKVDWKPVPYPKLYEEKIAVIGAGPAGLTAAHYLAQSGYGVTVFDSATEAGGMLKRGIPEFRLDREVVDGEVAKLESAGITFKLNETINKYSFDKIKAEFDAIVVATGAPNSKELRIDGWRMEGVMTALDFMEHVNNSQDVWRHPGQIFKFDDAEVVVIGGGSVAIDSARTAVRLGARKVTAICLESGEDIPCHKWELEEAEEEGVVLMQGYAPQKFVGTHPELAGVEVAKVRNFSKDENGQISFEIDKDSTEIVKADWVIVAIGQAPDSIWDELDGDKVFFAGDVKSKACSVVDAMASGKKIAGDVDKCLRDRGLKDPLSLRQLFDASLDQKIYPATRRKTPRPERPLLSAEIRKHTFDEVEGCFDDNALLAETQRCLGCGYQEVDADKCIGCGICQRLCPKGDAITLVAVQ